MLLIQKNKIEKKQEIFEQGAFCLLSPAITVQLQRCTETRRRCEMGRKEMWDKFIPPKADLAFRELMRNEEIRRHFISDVLGISLEDIRSVRLENTFLSRRSRQEKQCILDVRMLLNDRRRINVELQIRRLAFWDKRSLFYLAKMYTEGVFSGQSYDRLKKCIVISILDFELDLFPEYHKVYCLRDQRGRQYSDQFEIHVIELNKELAGDRMDDWIRLFRVKNREELDEMRSENPGVMKAVEEVRAMNLFKWAKWRYEEHLKYQRDLWALKVAAMQEGHAEGRAEGHAEGRAEGHAEGHAQGSLEQSRQVIYDFLGRVGEVPEDIRLKIEAEQDAEILKKWYLTAPDIQDFDEFRMKM